MPRIEIHSLDDPRLLPYRNLKATNETRWAGTLIAEGERVVERLLMSEFAVDSIFLSDRKEAALAGLVPAEVPLYVLPQALAQMVVGYNFHCGVLACGVRPPRRHLREVLDLTREQLRIVVCPNLTDPDNLGAIIRIASAFGVQAVLLGKGCADPFSRRVLRVSMGNAFFLPILETDDLASELRELQQHGFELAAAVLDESAQPLKRIPIAPRVALLLGNEAHGLEPQWQAMCDRKAIIPMQNNTDSLNVAVAAAIFLYHYSE